MSNGAGTGASGGMPTLLSIVFSQQGHIPQHPTPLQGLDSDLLNRALVFDKTPATGIPDFDSNKLAIASYPGGGSPSGHGSGSQSPGYGAPQTNGTQQSGGLTGGRSSLHFASRLHSGNNTGAESSNDDSFMRIPLKKKKKRPHNSLSPTGNGSPNDLDLKRRKKL